MPETTTEAAPATADEVAETGSEQEVAEGTETPTEEAAPAEASSDEDVGLNLEDYPEQLRPEVQKIYDKINTDFKRVHTKKFQDLSAKEKQFALEQETLKQQLEGFQRVAKEVLEDPTKIDAYRKVYGYGEQAPQQEDIRSKLANVQTVEELVDGITEHYETKMQAMESRLRQEATSATTTQISQHQQEQRWESALTQSRTDSTFTKYEPVITKFASSDPKYKSMYTGSNEAEVLAAATEDFKSLLRDDLDQARKDALGSIQKKKKAASVQSSGRTPQTDTTKTGASTEEIIARVNARLNSE